MDPNNSSPINSNISAQPAAEQQAPVQQSTPVVEPIPAASSNKGNKGIVILLIMVILGIGMATYVLFAKNQIKITQKNSTESTSVVTPTTAPVAAPVTVDEINVSSPDADLKSIETDAQGL